MMTAYMAALRCSQHAYEALSSRDSIYYITNTYTYGRGTIFIQAI